MTATPTTISSAVSTKFLLVPPSFRRRDGASMSRFYHTVDPIWASRVVTPDHDESVANTTNTLPDHILLPIHSGPTTNDIESTRETCSKHEFTMHFALKPRPSRKRQLTDLHVESMGPDLLDTPASPFETPKRPRSVRNSPPPLLRRSGPPKLVGVQYDTVPDCLLLEDEAPQLLLP